MSVLVFKGMGMLVLLACGCSSGLWLFFRAVQISLFFCIGGRCRELLMRLGADLSFGACCLASVNTGFVRAALHIM